MAKKYLRRIVVDGENYLWHRAHSHLKNYEWSPCVETLTVFPQHSKRNYLRIRFREEDNKYRTGMTGDWRAGYPQSGVLWLLHEDSQTIAFNLNRPGVVAAFIRLIRATQWNPTEGQIPLHIENGLRLLDESSQTLREMIEPSDVQVAQTRDGYGFIRT